MAHDPSFFGGGGKDGSGPPLAGMDRLRASRVFDSEEPSELDGAVEELYKENLEPEAETQDWSRLTHRVMRGVVENLRDREDADWAIRRASQGAVLAVAKRWGNIVLAGKASVAATREAACRSGLDSARAAQQAGLGAIDGALQVGPVAYPVLQREIAPMVEDLAGVLEEQRRASSREWLLASAERPLLNAPLREEPPPASISTAPRATVPEMPQAAVSALPPSVVAAIPQATPAEAPPATVVGAPGAPVENSPSAPSVGQAAPAPAPAAAVKAADPAPAAPPRPGHSPQPKAPAPPENAEATPPASVAPATGDFSPTRPPGVWGRVKLWWQGLWGKKKG